MPSKQIKIQWVYSKGKLTIEALKFKLVEEISGEKVQGR